MRNRHSPALGAALLALALGQAALPVAAAVSRPGEESDSRNVCSKSSGRAGAAHGQNVAMSAAPVQDNAAPCATACGEDGAVPIALLIRLHESALSMDTVEPESNCRQSGAVAPEEPSATPESRS